jgi:hypothetical protein
MPGEEIAKSEPCHIVPRIKIGIHRPLAMQGFLGSDKSFTNLKLLADIIGHFPELLNFFFDLSLLLFGDIQSTVFVQIFPEHFQDHRTGKDPGMQMRRSFMAKTRARRRINRVSPHD